MSYLRQTLVTGERVIASTRIHWMVFVLPIIVAALGIIALYAIMNAMRGPLDVPHPSAIAGPIIFTVLGLGFAAFNLIDRATTEIALTNKRVIIKRGWISRNTEEQRLEKIDSIAVTQSMFGRLFGYGTVDVRGSGQSLTPLKNVEDPIAFRRAAQSALDDKSPAQASGR